MASGTPRSRLRQPRIAPRLAVIILVATISLAAVMQVGLRELRAEMVAGEQGRIQAVTEAGHSILDAYHSRALSGEISQRQAQESAFDALRSIRYDDDEYMFSFAYDGVAMMHGANPSLEGQDLWNLEDPAGTLLVQNLVAAAQAAPEGGLVDYLWPPADDPDGEPIPKVSYSMAFEPWSLMIGTGVYVDDIDAAYATSVRSKLAYAGVILVLMLVVAGLVARGITRPLARLTDRMRSLADGDATSEVPGSDRRDEIGTMARAVQIFRDNAVAKAEMERTVAAEAARKAAEDAELAEERARTEAKEREMLEQLASEATQREIERVEAERRQHAALNDLANSFESEIGSIIGRVTTSVRDLRNAAGDVAATAEGAASSADDVASQAAVTSNEISAMASSGQELAEAVTDIGRAAAESVATSRQAVSVATNTNQQFERLAATAEAIDQVVSLISSIAGQTDLLALNASIEAARAGEAGRGFAVVASDVKLLAEETNSATTDIGHRVTNLKSEMEQAGAAISSIVRIVATIDEAADAISRAVERQREIAGTIAEGSARVARATDVVVSEMAKVSDGTSVTGAASQEMLAAVDGLSEDGDELSLATRRFLERVRS